MGRRDSDFNVPRFKAGDWVTLVNDNGGGTPASGWITTVADVGEKYLVEGTRTEDDLNYIKFFSRKLAISTEAFAWRFDPCDPPELADARLEPEVAKLERRCANALFKSLIREQRAEIASLKKELGRE